LVQEGYEVHLIATDKNVNSYNSDNVTIHPLPIPKSRFQRMARRWKVADMAARLSADLYHVHEPELLGPVLNRVGDRPVIYDAHESYADVLGQRRWIPQPFRPLAKALWKKIEPRLVRKCRAVVTVTEPLAEPYARMHERVEIIRNFPDLSGGEFTGVAAHERRQSCVFAGALAKDRNIENMVLAIGLLRKRNITLELWLAGEWENHLYEQTIQNLAAKEDVTNQVRYSGILSHKAAVALESQASIGMVTLLPIRNSLNSLPIKAFECMALGLPIVYSDFPLLQTYIGKCGVGLAVDPQDPVQIADALEYLLKNPRIAQEMGRMGRRAVEEKYNWSCEGTRLLELYREILGPRSLAV
jgi:glycosyltransferase involved in cell wall biosynthesis